MLTLKMAYRNLWRNKRRTGLSILAMVVASSMLMLAIGIINGMISDLITSSTDQYTSHIQISRKGYPDVRDLYQSLDHYQPILDLVRGLPEVTAASARLRSFGLLSFGSNTQAVEMLGIEPPQELKVTTLGRSLIRGKMTSPPGQVVIGDALARKLKAGVGSQLVYVTSAADGSIGNDLLTVAGIFKTGSSHLDGGLALVNLTWLEDVVAYPGHIHEVAIRIKKPDRAPEVAAKIALMADDPSLQVRSWQEILPDIKQALDFSGINILVTLFILYLATGLGIINSFFMIAYERTKEFGLMLSLGMTPREIRWLMVTEATLMGLISMILGGALGLGLLTWFHLHGIDLSAWITPVSYLGATFLPVLHAEFSWQGIVYPLLFLVFTAAGSAYIPALLASKLDPVHAMRRV
ncbi:MAG: ABC transporter permease [bacterium]